MSRNGVNRRILAAAGLAAAASAGLLTVARDEPGNAMTSAPTGSDTATVSPTGSGAGSFSPDPVTISTTAHRERGGPPGGLFGGPGGAPG